MRNPATAHTLHLRAEMFTETERLLVETQQLKITTFRYESGPEALRVVTARVEMILLPFRGQQVWRYSVDGEDLTMRTHFAEPTASTAFGETYGAFLLHCGLTGIGHPSPQDTHAHHGELPNATYRDARLRIRSEDGIDVVSLVGAFRLCTSHTADVLFEPALTVRSDSTSIDVESEIRNLRQSPFEYSYLCHVNWPIFDGAELVQTVNLDASHFTLAPDPDQDEPTAQYTAGIALHPESGNLLELERRIAPEYCAILKPWSDVDGWAHFLLRRTDGRAASVSYKTDALPYAIRWISNTGDECAAGFCLPSTAHHRGRRAAEADGMMRAVPGLGSVNMRIIIDLLDQEETAARVRLVQGR